jgi:[acyl-carrier-protein] S-malonyltransferase
VSNGIILCPGQGAQAVGMGRAWFESSPAARAVFQLADRALGDSLGAPLSEICFSGPADRLNQTDVSQPAIYVCSVASYRALLERDGQTPLSAAAGLSLGEYTALHLAGAFTFEDGLKLVSQRGRLMQQAASATKGGMVALIGADDRQAQEVCDRVRSLASASSNQPVLVCANFNAPGQVVLSGDVEACGRALDVAQEMGFKATPLTVAGAFHSPLMQSAADQMAKVLETVPFQRPNIPVWANVTAQPHDQADLEQLKRRLVEQIVRPVRWAQICQALASQAEVGNNTAWHELAPGCVLRGLMRRIDRNVKVTSHDQPT